MPAPLSEDLRRRVVSLYQLSGATYEHVAETLDIGRATVSRVLRLHRETGSVAPKRATGGPRRRLSEPDRVALKALVHTHPDATLEELAEQWRATHPDKAVSVRTIGRAVKRLGFTRKKSPYGPRKWTRSA